MFSDEQRLLAATSPAGLAVATSNGKWKLTRHLDLIDEAIVDAVAGRGPQRLVVECPPRHGKSELISHHTPAWYLGMFPDRQVMLASYEATFAETWGRKSRDLLEEFGKGLYGVSIKSDARAQDRWYTDKKGVMAASGIGGRFTGMGADLMIIDDPIKNAEDARSETIRAKQWDWWQSTATTRLHPNAVVIVLMTRWHEQDLGGMLLEQGHEDFEGDRFTEIRLPAIAEDDDPLGRSRGEALWPERYDAEHLGRIQKNVGSYWWSAMYQGRPTPEGGGMFQRKWFTEIDSIPTNPEDRIKWVRYWDFAATEDTGKTDPDYTAGALVGKRPNGNLVIADIQRDRLSPMNVETRMVNTARDDNSLLGHVPIAIEQEPGASGKIAADHYIRTVLAGFTARARKVNKNKVVRADPVSAFAEATRIEVVRAPWNDAFYHEAEQFPNGSHDDQIDAVSGAYGELMATAEVTRTSYAPTHKEPVVRTGDLTLRGERYIDADK
jgi:predicted phage terminase large subunit-like protein